MSSVGALSVPLAIGLPSTPAPLYQTLTGTSASSADSGDHGPEAEEIKDSHTLILEAKPFAFGGRADVYRGLWTPSGQTQSLKVAVKVLRFTGLTREMLQDYTKQLEKIDRRLAREMHAWELLHHPNITPLLGFKRSKNNIILGDSPFLVAPYYSRGNLLMYLAKNPNANRFTLLQQAASGLNYLHTLTPHPVCHLDVKGENILINDALEASICDFGLSRVLDNFITGNSTSNPALTLAFASPEIVMGEKGNTPSDVYSFAGVILQVLTGEAPYYRFSKNAAKMTLAIANGSIPQPADHPTSLPRAAETVFWKLLRNCWSKDPEDRPLMKVVMDGLKEIEDLFIAAAAQK